ncbi:MAG: N-acetylmuramoyl-L-alanine amidase [bacterium]|nr:N-acetylmuramoyl-L-alanine amidase [bacterium]
MYGQVRGKEYGVKLVRMSPWDSRVCGGRRKSGPLKTVKRALIVLTSMLASFSVCMGVIRFYGLLDRAETTVVPGSEVLSAGTEPDPVGAAEPEIVILPEPEPESEPVTPLIVLDPGHGGEDEGCSRGDVTEKDINLEIAESLAGKLQEMGFDVILTREDSDTFLSLEDRVKLAEDNKADIYVSIHQNACEQQEASVKGIETWYCERNGDSRRLAQLIHKGALGKTKAQERELCESDNLYVIRETSMPSCLIETGFLSNAEERENLCDPDYREKLAAGIAEGIQYYFNPKTMYLTFDDGPSEENTTAVLDILKAHNIKATFFVVGENVRKHPEVARRIVEEGHTVGIHCNRHVYDEIYESTESYLADFQEAYDAVYEITGVEVKLFRFPGGSVNCYNKEVYEDIIAEMTERGFIYFDWNASLEDATARSTPGQLIKNAVESTLGRKKVVMLAHDIVYNTTLCLEELIDSFPEYRMEPLTEEVAPIQFKIN